MMYIQGIIWTQESCYHSLIFSHSESWLYHLVEWAGSLSGRAEWQQGVKRTHVVFSLTGCSQKDAVLLPNWRKIELIVWSFFVNGVEGLSCMVPSIQIHSVCAFPITHILLYIISCFILSGFSCYIMHASIWVSVWINTCCFHII